MSDVFSGFNLINEKTNSILSTDTERFDDVEGFNYQRKQRHERIIKHAKTKISGEPKRSRITGKEIPPPISSIGRRVCFKSYRYNGRLVIKEEKILTQQILHAYREDGRLRLRFIRFDDGMEAKQEN
ncbi:hypothetical protein L1987_60984 [Smallanthus sonchifolius]|uniref:Uncharacterized protein n=1 Tax=Smallanthus sonchifolius TaxID=185202 RepID=A0ACB9D9Y4_9ASTR|nr:hypothetical protein L1987_60984 [Smallanthus sonchifolius]